jgi:Tfp pilus assembly protein PilP
MRIFLAAILLVLTAGPVLAIEKVGPAQSQGRETSELGEFSLKPLKIYSPRGRRDPFMAVRFGVTTTARPETLEFSISRLTLTGFIGLGRHKVAIFQLQNSGLSYSLRSGRFFGDDDKRVKQVVGRLLKNGDVELRQGERKIVFKNFRKD